MLFVRTLPDEYRSFSVAYRDACLDFECNAAYCDNYERAVGAHVGKRSLLKTNKRSISAPDEKQLDNRPEFIVTFFSLGVSSPSHILFKFYVRRKRLFLKKIKNWDCPLATLLEYYCFIL